MYAFNERTSFASAAALLLSHRRRQRFRHHWVPIIDGGTMLLLPQSPAHRRHPLLVATHSIVKMESTGLAAPSLLHSEIAIVERANGEDVPERREGLVADVSQCPLERASRGLDRYQQPGTWRPQALTTTQDSPAPWAFTCSRAFVSERTAVWYR